MIDDKRREKCTPFKLIYKITKIPEIFFKKKFKKLNFQLVVYLLTIFFKKKCPIVMIEIFVRHFDVFENLSPMLQKVIADYAQIYIYIIN